jgi:hypothetical protein
MLDLSSANYVGWFEVWQKGPLSKGSIANPVNEFVNTSSSWLHWLLIFGPLLWLTGLKSSLTDIVVHLRSLDLTPESEEASITGLDELPHAPLE